MPEKFLNRYRILSARLQTWDYGWNATYFITICNRDREHNFGEILNEEMQLSEIGKIAVMRRVSKALYAFTGKPISRLAKTVNKNNRKINLPAPVKNGVLSDRS